MWRNQTSRSGAVVFGLTIALAACGITDDGGPDVDGQPLTVKLSNDGTYALTAFRLQPADTVSVGTTDEVAWGANLLPIPRLEANKYIVLQDIGRKNFDALYTFDKIGMPEHVTITQLRADWLSDDCIEFMVSLSDTGQGGGHQWGCDFSDTANDVTP